MDWKFLGRPLLTSKGFYPSLHDKTMAARLREAYNVCDKHRDVATASLIEVWIDETERRRHLQEEYNTEHGITPTGITKSIEKGLRPDLPEEAKRAKLDLKKIPKDEYKSLLKDLTGQMDLAAANLQFEQAAELRDIINDIKSKM